MTPVLALLLIALGALIVAATWREIVETSAMAAADTNAPQSDEQMTTIHFAPPWGAAASSSALVSRPSTAFDRVETRQGETVPAAEGHAAPSHQLRSDLMPETAPRGVTSESSTKGVALDLMTEAAVVNALAGLVDDSRGRYARAVEGAALDTIGRRDITTDSIGAVVKSGAADSAPTPATPKLASAHPIATPSPVAWASAAPQTTPPSSVSVTPPAATQMSVTRAVAASPVIPSPQHVTSPTAPDPASTVSADIPHVAARSAAPAPKTKPPLWLAGNRHLVAWLPMTEAPVPGATVTGALLAVAVDRVAARVIGVEARATNLADRAPVLTAEMLRPRSFAHSFSSGHGIPAQLPRATTPVALKPVTSPRVSEAMSKVGAEMKTAVSQAHGESPTSDQVLKTSREFVNAAQRKTMAKRGGAVKANRIVTVVKLRLDAAEKVVGVMSAAEAEALAGSDENDLD